MRSLLVNNTKHFSNKFPSDDIPNTTKSKKPLYLVMILIIMKSNLMI